MLRFHSVVVALLLAPAALWSQRNTVPLDDPVYQDLDRILGIGLVDHPIVGQRPFTRAEIARLVAQARSGSGARAVSPVVARLIERLEHRFGDTTRAIAPPRWRADALGLSSPSRLIPPDSNGAADALINPLLDDDAGREFYNGGSVALEYEREWEWSRRAAFRVRPRVAAGAHAGEVMARGSVQALSATVKAGNLRFEVGRRELVWGPGIGGGLLASTSGRPLDMLHISTEELFRIPYFSDVFGPLRGEFVVADLGARQRFPHSFLVGYKLSGRPRRWLEMSAQVVAEQGGRGAPRTTLVEHIKDLIPVLKVSLRDDSTQFSNKFAGWDYRVRLPGSRGVELYAEHVLDDADPRRWASTFWEDGSHTVGAAVADLGADGALSGTFELQHTGIRMYEHGVFRSGYASNQVLVGSPLGNDANGAQLRLRWDAGGARAMSLTAAVERRGGDVYTTAADPPNEDNFRFVRVHRHPAEWRGRLMLDVATLRAARRVTWRVGVEQARNYDFRPGTRFNVLAGAIIDAVRPGADDQRP